MTRREARELAFVLLFEKTFTNDSFEQIIENASESRDIKVNDYAKNTCVNIELNKIIINEAIQKYSKNWNINRISRIAISALRLALYEIMFEKEIPFKVSTNESVELAKKYAGEQDSSFVNGVLGAYIRENVEGGENFVIEVQLEKDQAEIVKEQAEIVEKQAEIVEEQAEIVEEQAEIVEDQAEIVEDQAEIVEDQAEIVEDQAEIVEEQAEIVEDQAEIVEEQVEIVEEQVQIVEEQAEIVKEKAEDGE